MQTTRARGAALSATGRRERRGLVLAFAVFGVFWGAWSAVLPAVQRDAGLDDGQLGVALGVIAVAALPTMPLAGRIADRYGARRALPAALLAFGAVLPLLALSDSLVLLGVWLVLLGVATGALDVIVNAATASWERIERGRLMSVAHGAFSVGVLVGAAAAGLAREAGAGASGVITAVGVLVIAVGLIQPPYRRAPAAPPTTVRRRVPALLVGIGLLTAGAFFVEDALQSWSALHLERGLGATPAISGLGPGLFAAAMAAGRLAGGGLSRRYHDDQLLVAFGGLLAAGIALTAVAPTPLVALVGLTVAGAGTSVLAPVLYSAVGARAPAGREGADLATVTALGYLGFVAGPPTVGVLSAATSLPVALGSLSVIGLLVAVLGPLVLPRRDGRLEPSATRSASAGAGQT